VKNRRKWLDDFAKERKFDPLIAQNWYSFTTEKVLKAKGARSMLRHHQSSIINALVSLYPEVRFKKSKFTAPPRKYWKSSNNRKLFFIQFAKQHKFDPFVAENWQSVSRDALKYSKGGSMFYTYYGGNLRTALVQLFPNMEGLHETFVSRKKSE